MSEINNPPPDLRDHVVVSVNPRAGRRAVSTRVAQLNELLCRRGLTVEVLSDLDHVAVRANQCHAQGRLRVLIGVGGDGTAAELVNRTAPGVPLTLLPAGTSNLLARHYGLPQTPHELAEVITSGTILSLDAGRANGRVFLLMVGCGFDAEVVQQVHRRRSSRGGGHISYLSYIKPILESIRSYAYPELHVSCGAPCAEGEDGGQGRQDGEGELHCRWAFVFNFPKYGWGLPLAPDATPADGLLDLCALRRGSLWHGLRYVAAAQFGVHQRMADCQCRRAGRFRISSAEPASYQLDGDPGGQLPVDVEVLPSRLTLLVPSRAADQQGT